MKSIAIISFLLLVGGYGFGQIITANNDTIIIGSNEYNAMINKLNYPEMDSAIYFKYKDFPSVDSVFYIKEYDANYKFIHDGWVILETPSKKGNLRWIEISENSTISVTHYLGIHRFYFPSNEPKKKIMKVLEATNEINGKKKETIYDEKGMQTQMIIWKEKNKITLEELFKPNYLASDYKNIKGINTAQVIFFRNQVLNRIENYDEGWIKNDCWKWYDNNIKLKKERRYYYGELISKSCN